MNDSQNTLQFGYFLTPDAQLGPELVPIAQQMESWGLDLIGIQDHPYQARFLDTLTLIATLAAQTQRIRFFPDVSNLPLRPPAVLAKSAATIDLLSGGRFELGLGAGGFWNAIAAMGGPRRTPGESVAALEEAIQIIRLMWSGQRSITFDGQYYSVKGLHPGPTPAHPIGIWVGAYGPRMMNLIGRLGDGWVPSLPYLDMSKARELQRRIDEGAAQAGRDPRTIRRILNIAGQITPDGSPRGELLQGSAAQWVEDLNRLVVEYGFDSFVLMGDDLNQIRRFAEEIVPQVRAQTAP